MKKLLSLALLSTLICFSVQAEEGVYSNGEITKCGKDETLICDLYGNLLDGVVKEYHTDGTLYRETPYKNGQIDGVEKWYNEDGTLSSETPYKNGQIDGVVKLYIEDGTLYNETPYKNGQEDDVVKIYREDGTTLDKEIHYDKNGEIIKEVKY